jgi:hypothetical protein
VPLQSNNKYSQQVARALLSADFSAVAKAVVLMAPHMSRKAAFDLIDRLSPFWVDAQAVAPVPEIIQSPQKQRAICVNGSFLQFTPKSYLGRAQLSMDPWVSVRVNLPKGYEEQPDLQVKMLEKEIQKQILQQLLLADDDEQDLISSGADFLLANREKKEPLFIIVPGELDEQVFDALREKFFRFTFFVLKKGELLDPAKLELSCIRLLEPKLDPQNEEKAFELYSTTRYQINDRSLA